MAELMRIRDELQAVLPLPWWGALDRLLIEDPAGVVRLHAQFSHAFPRERK